MKLKLDSDNFVLFFIWSSGALIGRVALDQCIETDFALSSIAHVTNVFAKIITPMALGRNLFPDFTIFSLVHN